MFTDDYSGNDIIFTFNPFIISPNFCGVSIFCNNVQAPAGVNIDCIQLDGNNELILNFDKDSYLNGEFAPGAYIFTYDV